MEAIEKLLMASSHANCTLLQEPPFMVFSEEVDSVPELMHGTRHAHPAIQIISHAEFLGMTRSEIQSLFSVRHLLVTQYPVVPSEVQWGIRAMRRIGNLDQIRQIHGMTPHSCSKRIVADLFNTQITRFGPATLPQMIMLSVDLCAKWNVKAARTARNTENA